MHWVKVLFGVLMVVVAMACSEANGSSLNPAPGSITVTVQSGQYLQWIANKRGVGWESMLLANENFLRTKYDEVCDELSGRFRNRRRDGGAAKGGLYYCNDRFNRAYGNTLRPGWKLVVPASQAPADIATTIASIQGNKVALVIDDTGSMTEDRQRVSEFYLAAIRKYNKRLTGVWLYADGGVRKYEAGGVKFLTAGGLENTHGALSEAAKSRPDAIILVTDEPGDDWQWDEVKNLPPVYGHCLPDQGGYGCEESLRRLATEVRGSKYIRGVK